MKTLADKDQVGIRWNGNRDSTCQSQEQSAHSGRAVNQDWASVKGAIRMTCSYFCSVYLTVAICSVSRILQLFLKLMQSVCTMKQ